MKQDTKQEYYDTKTSSYRPSVTRARKIVELIQEDVESSSVLDIGCSEGLFGAELEKRGARVTGWDISLKAVAVARERLTDARQVDVERGDTSQWNSSFDVVIAGELVEHLFHPDQFLEKVHDLLKPGGLLVVTTPNFLVWSNRIKMLLGRFRYTKTGFLDESHIHFFTYATLREDLTQAGFTIEDENHVIHPKVPEFLGRRFPSLFAFQFVIKARA